jgi:hypothetical protein
MEQSWPFRLFFSSFVRDELAERVLYLLEDFLCTIVFRFLLLKILYHHDIALLARNWLFLPIRSHISVEDLSTDLPYQTLLLIIKLSRFFLPALSLILK